MEQLSEDLLGDPSHTAEHVAADTGISSLLGGNEREEYNPKQSPFNFITKLADKSPYIEAFPKESAKAAALTEIKDMKESALDKIEKGSKNLFGYGEAIKSEDKNHKDFHELYDHTARLSTDPNVLATHLANQTGPISEHLPNTTIALSQLATKATDYLQNQKPNLIAKSPLDSDRKPSQMEIAKFNDVANVLENPVSILSHLKEGTLTHNHVTALHEVYPKVLESIQSSVLDNMTRHKADDKEPISLPVRLGLSKLFGSNMDGSLSSLANNQMVLSQNSLAQKTQDAALQKPSKSGISKMKAETRDQTRYQQTLMRQA